MMRNKQKYESMYIFHIFLQNFNWINEIKEK